MRSYGGGGSATGDIETFLSQSHRSSGSLSFLKNFYRIDSKLESLCFSLVLGFDLIQSDEMNKTKPEPLKLSIPCVGTVS